MIQKGSSRKILVENYFLLSFLQGVNGLLPLIALPYLLRVIGVEKYGLIAFANALTQYFIIFTDYGFNLTATREISLNRDNKAELSRIFSCVMTIKMGITVLALGALCLLLYLVPSFREEQVVYILSFGMVLGNVLFPTWFYQGIEKMKYIVILNALPKIIFTGLIFVVVKDASGYIYVPLLISLGFIVGGVLAYFYAFKNFALKYKVPSFAEVVAQLKSGWLVFASLVSISLYTWSNTFLLGIFTNNTVVGYFAAAERLIRGVQGLLNQGSNAIFPHISKLAGESKEKGLFFIKKTLLILGSGTFLISAALFISADYIGPLVFGNAAAESVLIFKILAFIPFITQISNILGIQTMLAFDYKKAFFLIYFLAGVINVIMALILIPLFSAEGIAWSSLIAEILVTVMMIIYVSRKFRGITAK